MTSLETGMEFPHPFEDQMFAFPNDLAIFPASDGYSSSNSSSPASDFDAESFGVYEHQKPAPAKLPTVAQRRQERIASLAPLDLTSSKKSLLLQQVQQQVVPVPVAIPLAFQPGYAPAALLAASTLPVGITLSSRVKSTTPNIALLFSLFDVLEGEDDSSASSSPAVSPHSSISSGWQTPESSTSPARHGVSPGTKPAAPAAAFPQDRTSILSHLADGLN